jgi:hypothetical protein
MDSIVIHPYVWSHVADMYKRCYGTDDKLQIVFELLKLEPSTADVRRSNLEEFLNRLSFGDALKILRDILEMDNFWLNQYDEISLHNNSVIAPLSYMFNRQFVPREEKYWGKELVSLLENKNGIIYDRKTKSFSFKGVSDIRTLPTMDKHFSDPINRSFGEQAYSLHM